MPKSLSKNTPWTQAHPHCQRPLALENSSNASPSTGLANTPFRTVVRQSDWHSTAIPEYYMWVPMIKLISMVHGTIEQFRFCNRLLPGARQKQVALFRNKCSRPETDASHATRPPDGGLEYVLVTMAIFGQISAVGVFPGDTCS